MPLPIKEARQIAVEHGLALCTHCEQPEEQHCGYDHGAGKCLLARNLLDLTLRYPNKQERHDAVERINRYNAAHQAAEEAWLTVGGGI